jgi:hypothetical protein
MSRTVIAGVGILAATLLFLLVATKFGQAERLAIPDQGDSASVPAKEDGFF